MSYRTIIIRKDGPRNHDEAKATAATIMPGHIIERTSGDLVQKHSTAGGTVGPLMVAIEDEMQGRGISTAYAASSIVQYEIFARGERFVGRLANGEDVAIGDRLESDGAGGLRKQVTGGGASTAPQRIIGISRTALNNTTGAQAAIEVEAA